MASNATKKRLRSKRASRREERSKRVPLDAAQMKELMKQAVREVLQEERQSKQAPSGQRGADSDWLEKARRVRSHSPALPSSVGLVRDLREERASR